MVLPFSVNESMETNRIVSESLWAALARRGDATIAPCALGRRLGR
jgi:hypothetical protein